MTDNGYLHNRSNNFGKVPIELITDSRISAGAVRLYAYMHWRYGSNMKNFEGRRSMAEALGVSDRTITNYIAELEAHDWVVVIPRKGKASNFYHVFELQSDCQEWRKTHNRPKPERPVEERKSRKGIGGYHSFHTAQEQKVNSSSPSEESSYNPVDVNSSSATDVNSSSAYPDSYYPDSVNTFVPSPNGEAPAGDEKVTSPISPTPATAKKKRGKEQPKTLDELTPMQRIIATRAHRIQSGQGITKTLLIRINLVVSELRQRFGTSDLQVTPEELDQAYTWHNQLDGKPTLPADGVKTANMMQRYRESRPVQPAAAASQRKDPDPNCPKCHGQGAVSVILNGDQNKRIGAPCPTCLPEAFERVIASYREVQRG